MRKMQFPSVHPYCLELFAVVVDHVFPWIGINFTLQKKRSDMAQTTNPSRKRRTLNIYRLKLFYTQLNEKEEKL